MEKEEKIFNNEKYYYIAEYDFKFGKVYKFANLNNQKYCFKEDGNFVEIKNKKILKKLKKEFYEIESKDII